jgi:type VI secretion system protein ImpL
VTLRHVNRLRTENDSGTPDLAVLTKLRGTLVQIEQDLVRPELAYLAHDKLDLGEPLRDLRSTLRGIGGQTMADAVTDEWITQFLALRRRLFEYQSPGLGPLLGKNPEKGGLELTAGITAVRTTLDGFLGQSFVQLTGDRQPLTTPDGAYRVSWNEELLRQTVALSDAYAAFVRDRVPSIYPDIREVVRGTALERLGNSMPILIGQARRIERITRPSSDVQALQDILSGEVSELKRVGGLLRQILDLYERLGLKSQQSELYRQVEDDMREILRRLDLILDRNDLYRVSAKLAQWRGQRPPSLDAFDVEDGEGLNQYLKAQRTTVRNLARDFAKTPVSLLDGMSAPGGGSASDPLFTRWRNIVTEVEHFEAMTPGNSVKELESFVDTTLLTVTPENCQERLPRRSGDSRDFFLQSRARIYDAVRKRCSQFVEERILESYDRLAARFNKSLAGRFPFSKNPSSLDEEEANPRDVRAFFADFDQFLPKYDAFIAREDASQATGAVRRLSSFMESMRNVRPFFAPLLNEKSTDSAPKYNLTVEYRVNRQAEINGNQIAEWSLAVADQRIDDTQTTWQLGDKLRLSMRWAKDGPYHPSSVDQGKGTTVDNNDTIHFEWGGYWGILRFLRIYRSLPSDLRKAVDRQPHILKFIVEIVERKRSGRLRLLPDSAYNRKEASTNTAAKNAFIFNRAVIFVRLGLSIGDSKDAIIGPAEWPSSAVLAKSEDFK